jgi:hypothetical protein
MGPDGFSFCLGKVNENTPFVLILTRFIVCFRGQVNRSAILNTPKHSEKPIASTWFRQFGLPEVPTNQRFFDYNPTIATLPTICCKPHLAFSLRDRSCTVLFDWGLFPPNVLESKKLLQPVPSVDLVNMRGGWSNGKPLRFCLDWDANVITVLTSKRKDSTREANGSGY